MKRSFRSRRPAGLSLIEIMIALAIGIVLLLGLVEVFSASRTAYQLSTGLARVQENGRFAMDFLQRDIRMAGHFGCVNDQARFLPGNVTATRPALASTLLTDADQTAGNYQNVGKEWLRFDIGVQGFDAKIGGGGAATASGSAITLAADPVQAANAASWQPALSADMFGALNDGTGRPVQNSDVLVLRFFNPSGAPMTSFTPGDTATLKFTQPGRLAQGIVNPGLFAISDCINAAVFEASAPIAIAGSVGTIVVTKGAGANKSGLLGNQTFVAGQAALYRAETVVYYVGINGSGNPALYRIRYNLPPNSTVPTSATTPGGAGGYYVKDELVEGIESLQLQYGQDSQLDADKRPTGNIGSSVIANALQPAADPGTAWRRVGLVQVGIVARSPDRASATQRDKDVSGNSLSALGVEVLAPDDARFRTVYEDSIALRNRLFGN